MHTSLKFVNSTHSLFHVTLKQRVDAYFAENKIPRYGNSFMVFKTIFFITLTSSLYFLLLFQVLTLYWQLITAMLLGISMAFIGFNICHDALHGSYSHNRNINRALGFIFNVIGANTYVWNLTHNIVHHSYTNIVDHDNDIEIAPGLIRVHTRDKANAVQRYQHFYAFFLYSFTTLSWFFRKDYLLFFKKKLGDTVSRKHPQIEYFNLFFYKGIYYFLFIVLPLSVMQLTTAQFILGFLAMNFAEGLVLGLVFQLAHVVEDTAMVHADNKNIEDAWAVHQLKTTANFAPGSRLANFFCGGLNLQVEHHLFPKICHVHYRHLSPIVQQTAKEFGLPYHVNTSFYSALRSHYFLLKKMGRSPRYESSA